MDPRKNMIVAVVGVAAGVAGCSAGGGTHAASSAHVSSTVSTAAGTTSTTAAPTTTTSASTTTTVAPTTTTRAVTTTVAPAAHVAQAAPVPTTPPCPSNLASQLASTGSARQLITVESAGSHTTTATVELWQRSGSCWTAVAGPWGGYIGENGFADAAQKREGDGATPTGMYGLGPVMYGNAANPGVREPYHRIVCGDWWDEDSNSGAYNTFQAVGCNSAGEPRETFGGGSEALWQETQPYPSFAVIGYNTGPIVPGAGSAIFFHAATGGPTAGCVSVPLPDLDMALRWLDPSQAPAFVMGPASEITRF